MALPTAQPAEVLRAWQKDDYYEKQLAGSLARLMPSNQASKAVPISSLLYKSFTTLNDLQTLGEEYSGIVQVDETYHKLPTFSNRLLSIVLSAFGENLTRRILRYAENVVEQNATIKPAVQNSLIVLLKALSNMVPQFESIHRALCYIGGGPIQLGKTASGIDYVQVRPAAAAYYAHLRLLGMVTLLHAFVSCGQSLYQAKRHMDQMREFPNEVDSNKSCVACLEQNKERPKPQMFGSGAPVPSGRKDSTTVPKSRKESGSSHASTDTPSVKSDKEYDRRRDSRDSNASGPRDSSTGRKSTSHKERAPKTKGWDSPQLEEEAGRRGRRRAHTATPPATAPAKRRRV